MKYIVNTTYGSFYMTITRLNNKYGFNLDPWDEATRINKDLIHFVEQTPPEKCALGVVEIPANATDWRVEEYDGSEHIIAVVDGKLVDIY